MNPFAYEPKTRVHYGPGLITEAASIINSMAGDVSRAVIVTDPGVMAAGITDRLVSALKAQQIDTAVFSGVKGEPTTDAVDQAAELVRRNDPQAVIGLGGGSAMDIAKLAAVVAGQDASADHFSCVSEGLPQPGRLTLMIPTTAGTGAEVNRAVVYYNSKGHKVWAWGRECYPDLAILDPELTVGLPPELTAMTGFDVLVHAIEACGHAQASPFSTAHGIEAIRLASRSLEKAYHHGDDIAARGDMLVAACLAGVAIDVAGCGMAHAMGHALATLAGVHHGRAVTMVLSAAMAWNAEGAPGTYARIADAMGLDGKGMDETAKAMAAVDEFQRLISALDFDISAAGSNIGPDDVDRLVDLTLTEENAGMCEVNCRIPTTDDLKAIAGRVLNR